ncbi:MAG: hypothetical protein DI585_00795 [Pseudomonas fluorescens]|nr:MAG: hypothetical protein DI585_00795 [Pseudomonas fluorescens]
MSTSPFNTPEMLAEKQANRDRLLGSLTLRPLEHERISFMDIRIIDDLEPDKRPRDASKLGNMIRRVWTTRQPLGIRAKDDTLLAVVISAETWEKAYPLLKEAGLVESAEGDPDHAQPR